MLSLRRFLVLLAGITGLLLYFAGPAAAYVFNCPDTGCGTNHCEPMWHGGATPAAPD